MISFRAARSARARRAASARPAAAAVGSAGWPGVGAGVAEQGGGEAVQHVGVHPAGDDRDDRGVAVRARRRRSAGPGRLGGGGAGQAAELVQSQVQQDLGGLPGPLGQPPGGDQPPARLLEGVVLTLALAAQILRPGPLAQRVQHRAQRRRAAGGQVPVEAPGATEGGLQPHPPVREPVTVIVVGLGQPAPHLLRQRAQVGQRGPGRGRAEQDLVRVPPVLLGQQIGPVADLPRPRRRQRPGGQRPGHRRMRRQPPRPPHRRARRAAR